ncbi:MAG: hypothetical protein JO022_14015 [Acidobacteriaceae bacterium]|nr:hypothetical protein [Acidobacteriaceae bacterium]
MARGLVLAVVLWRALPMNAEQPSAQAIAAFDEYAKATETEFSKTLWLDQHKHEKSLVWLNQGFVVEHKTQAGGRDISVPGAVLQDWIGETFIPGATIDRVRDTVLDYGSYKDWFRDAVMASRTDNHNGDHFDVFLRLHRRQIAKVVVNAKFSADYQLMDPTHAWIVARSVHTGEAKYGKNKPYEEEVAPEDENGLLWRMNYYWRLEAADNGVYAELEVLTLSREAGKFAASRVLNGFVDNFPKEYTRYTSDHLREMLAPPVRK